MATTTTPNMGLILPVPGSEPGPDYADEQNASFSIIDGHNHTSGSGVLVPSSGLDINSDLAFQNTNPYQMRSSRYTNQSAPLAAPADLCCVYFSGGNFYINNSAGTAVQVTSGGSVNAGAGSITGLPSGTASVTYGGGKYTFQSSTLTSAPLDAGSVILRNNTASSKGLTLSPPNAMASDFGLTLPSVPAAQSFMTCDPSGNMAAPWTVDNSTLEISGGTTIQVKDDGITNEKLAPLNDDISTTSGSQNNASDTVYRASGCIATITTVGRPVLLSLQPDGLGNTARMDGTSSGANAGITCAIARDTSTTLCEWVQVSLNLGTGTIATLSVAPTFTFIDTTVTAGTHTYELFYKRVSSGTLAVLQNLVLVAVEL